MSAALLAGALALLAMMSKGKGSSSSSSTPAKKKPADVLPSSTPAATKPKLPMGPTIDVNLDHSKIVDQAEYARINAERNAAAAAKAPITAQTASNDLIAQAAAAAAQTLNVAPTGAKPPPAPMPAVAVPAAPKVSPTPSPAAAAPKGPKPTPAGYDPAKARAGAKALAAHLATKGTAGYSRELVKTWQRQAGMEKVDGIYGGATRGALQYFGVKDPPRAFFKPVDTIPYVPPEQRP